MSTSIAIFACHGGSGEDGRLQAIFSSHGIACSAGSFDGLACCMNKQLFKAVMRGYKIPVAKGICVSKSQYKTDRKRILKTIRLLGFPLILKPNNGGSSIGLFVAKCAAEFDEMIINAFEFDSYVIVEKYVANAREFNVAIVGTQTNMQVSEVDEPIKNNDVLTFADKYLSNKSSKPNASGKNSFDCQLRKFPADIPQVLSDKLKFLAQRIFRIFNLSGVVRIDFLYQEKINKIYVCEVNAVPGSLAFYFFNENKITTNNLVLKLIECAKSNLNKMQNFKAEFSTKILPKK